MPGTESTSACRSGLPVANAAIPGQKPLILYAVGDTAPRRESLATMFHGVSDLLRGGDIVFGQLETNVSSRGERAPAAKLAMRTRPEAARAMRSAGFTHMSFASNHCMDWGATALRDTLANMAAADIGVCGAGENIDAARRPALAAAQDTTVAFLAYSSILPEGYCAESARPGCAPMRAHTVYEQIEHDQPGTPCRVRTFAWQDDLSALVADAANARSRADIVIVSLHWGLHFTPDEITDYQREVARAAVDAGADAVLGHHPHILKGVDVYRGKPIFYSLGNFAIEQPWAFEADVRRTESYRNLTTLSSGWKEDGQYMLPEDTRKSLIVKFEISARRILRTCFIPVYLTTSSEPEVLDPAHGRFREVVDYVEAVSRSQGLGAMFAVTNGEVEVTDAERA